MKLLTFLKLLRNSKNSIEYPKIIPGEKFEDHRGIIKYNNQFNLHKVLRIYEITNKNSDYTRGWKGHLIESRWFTCTKGEIQVSVVELDVKLKLLRPNTLRIFNLNQESFDILFVPPGYATAIKQKTANSRIMAFADSLIGQSNDEDLRWPYKDLKL